MTKAEKQEFLTEIMRAVEDSEFVERNFPYNRHAGTISLWALSDVFIKKFGWEDYANNGY